MVTRKRGQRPRNGATTHIFLQKGEREAVADRERYHVHVAFLTERLKRLLAAGNSRHHIVRLERIACRVLPRKPGRKVGTRNKTEQNRTEQKGFSCKQTVEREKKLLQSQKPSFSTGRKFRTWVIRILTRDRTNHRRKRENVSHGL